MRNSIWFIFLLAMASLFSWFAFRAVPALTHYFKLNRETEVAIVGWKVVQKAANRYVLSANFIFEFQGKEVHGESEIGPLYPNPWAAEKGLERWRGEKYKAWYSSSAPEKAVLEKRFPFKIVFSAAILLGVFLYFFLLGKVVERKRV